MSKITPEGSVKRAICDLLDAEGILYFRMNAGMTVLQGANGKRRMIAGHRPGTADILAAPIHTIGIDENGNWCDITRPLFLWIEAKRPKGGKQSEAQAAFQRKVEAQGHIYMIATSSDDVLAKLRELGCETSQHPKRSPTP